MNRIFTFLVLLVYLVNAKTGLAKEYHAMVRELEDSINEELAKVPESTKREYEDLAKSLGSKVTLQDKDRAALLEINKKTIQKMPSYCSDYATDSIEIAQLKNKQTYIFVSSSMNKQNLINLGKEASKQGATLVMRGFIYNSYIKTAEFLKTIIDQTGQGVVIDPNLFETYVITEVPSFVISEGNEYDKLTGNVSLAYALGEIKNKGEILNNNK